MSATLPKMLHSIVGQSYDNWRIILIDDCSSKEEREKCSSMLYLFKALVGDQRPGLLGYDYARNSKIYDIWNSEKRWEVANVLWGLQYCDDNDIICRIDGDDWLTDLDALTIIDAAYKESGCDLLWTNHRWAFSDKNISGPMPPGADPYRHPWVSSHLKTFRKHLLNGVPYENFLNQEGILIRRAGDQGCYLPALYKSKKHAYLPRCMYHYSIDERGGLVYQTEDAKFQKEEAEFLRRRGYVEKGPSWEEVLFKR
jgi:glycosyltransferase involved in cell wall biosynthesis